MHTDHKGVPHIKKAKLNLVDLAGSERHGKTGKWYIYIMPEILRLLKITKYNYVYYGQPNFDLFQG